jgi:hypothetical protein
MFVCGGDRSRSEQVDLAMPALRPNAARLARFLGNSSGVVGVTSFPLLTFFGRLRRARSFALRRGLHPMDSCRG